MKKKTAISILISILFLYIALKGISFAELSGALQKCNYLYLIPALGLTLMLYVIRSIRWYYFVKPIKETSFKNLLSAVMIGFMANNIFPARAGEFVRANILGNDEKIKKSSVFATIVIERLFDGMSLLFIVLAVFLTVDLSERLSGEVAHNLKSVAYGALGLYMVLILFLVLLSYHYEKTLKLIMKFLKPFPKAFSDYMSKLIESFCAGVKIEKDFKNLANKERI